MKKILLVIFFAVLCPCLNAQYEPATLSAQQHGIVSSGWGPMDLWLPMSASAPCSQTTGTALTITILGNCTIGGTFSSNNFGNTIAGNSSFTPGQFFPVATPFETGTDSNGYTPLSLLYFPPNSVSTTLDIGLYTNSASAPGTLLCHIGNTSVTTSANNYNTYAVTSDSCPTLTASTVYWIAWVSASATLQVAYNSGTCPGTSLHSVFTSAGYGSAVLPSSFGASTADTACYSYYIAANGNTPSMTYVVPGGCCSTFTTAASTTALGGSVTVTGITYPSSTATQSEQMANGTADIYFTTNSQLLTIKAAPIQTITSNGYITFGAANSGGLGTTFDLVNFFDNGTSPNGFAVLGFNNGNFGACGYCAYVEANPGGTTTFSTGIPVTPGSTYQFTFLMDEVGGVAKLALYTPGTCTQVGSTVTVAQITGNNIVNWRVGNAETGTSTGNTTFQNLMLDWTNHAFPNCP